MNQRPARPENMSWVSPVVTVKNLADAIHFYEKAFGFKTMNAMNGPEGDVQFAELTYQNEMLMFRGENAFGSHCHAPASSGTESPIKLYLYTENVDDFFKHAVSSGAEAVEAPTNMFWGDRLCRLRDPSGHVWSFATNVADFDPSQVPQ